MTNPVCGEIVIGYKAECPKCRGMIGTFITQVPGVAVHVLHGKSWSVLDAQHRLLSCKCQLNMCAGLSRAQAHTSSMFGVTVNTRICITGNRATVPEKRHNHGT